ADNAKEVFNEEYNKQKSDEISNNSDEQEIEVNKMSIETSNIKKSPRLELIEVEITSVETQYKTKAITTTKNIAKSMEGIKTT
ncbi:3876_t:CDS:1, partial [Scutellospora calospora]